MRIITPLIETSHRIKGTSMTTFRSAEVSTPGAKFSFVDREVADPSPGHVTVAVEACGVCHTDSAFVDGHLAGLQFPLTPGHEIAGHITAVGEYTQPWRVGDRVAVGWVGGYCGHCPACRRGEFVHCSNQQITGAAFRGGYAEQVHVPASGLARIPDGLSATEAAPLACAGVTMFHSLRRSSARSGDLVAILGIGGLGHLGVQFAAKMGFRTVAIARGTEKQDFAFSLGAHHYIDSTATDVAHELQDLGGARVIAATAANADAISAAIGGLGSYGELLALAAVADPIHVTPVALINNSGTIHGHPAGVSQDVEDTMNFAVLQDIRPLTETLPLDRVNAGYQRMMANQARYRVVLTTD
jgi:alcohol dehydrogenase